MLWFRAMGFTIATWNVNSLRMRHERVMAWLAEKRPDVLCLQELKMEEPLFPAMELASCGYRSVVCGQKSYNGVAILSRAEHGPPAEVAAGLLDGDPDPEARLIAATIPGLSLRVLSVYVPNGQVVGCDKYDYKLRWLAALTAWLRDELARHDKLALAGDFNIAPEPRDVHDPVLWDGQVLFSEPERAAFRALLDLGLKDAFRLFDQPERSFTWWDYRNLAFRRKWGLRIDHILLAPALAAQCTACTIDVEPRRREQPSDHAPVIATLG